MVTPYPEKLCSFGRIWARTKVRSWPGSFSCARMCNICLSRWHTRILECPFCFCKEDVAAAFVLCCSETFLQCQEGTCLRALVMRANGRLARMYCVTDSLCPVCLRVLHLILTILQLQRQTLNKPADCFPKFRRPCQSAIHSFLRTVVWTGVIA